MLAQLFNLVKNESQTEIISNPIIPDEQNNHAVGMATDSIFSGLQGALANGGLKHVLNMFSDGGDSSVSSPITGDIIQNLTGSLVNKFGMNTQSAEHIASTVVPSVLQKMISKTNDPADQSFNINGVISSLMGSDSTLGCPVQIPGAEGSDADGIDFGSIVQNLSGSDPDRKQLGLQGLDNLSGLIGRAVTDREPALIK